MQPQHGGQIVKRHVHEMKQDLFLNTGWHKNRLLYCRECGAVSLIYLIAFQVVVVHTFNGVIIYLRSVLVPDQRSDYKGPEITSAGSQI